MSDAGRAVASIDMWAARPNILDPLADRLLGAGKPFQLMQAAVGGRAQMVFSGAPRTLAAIYAKASIRGARNLIVHSGVTLGHAETFARAASLAAVLRDRYGVRRGSVVALVMGNRPEFVIALIAITAAGGVAALVNSRGAAVEMRQAIATCEAMLAIFDSERADVIATVGANDPPWPRIIAGLPVTPLRREDMSFDAATGTNAAFAPFAVDPADGAVILFTSGTTGFPKAALLSHGAIAHGVMLSRFIGALQDLRWQVENGGGLARMRPVDDLPRRHPAADVPPIGDDADLPIVEPWHLDPPDRQMERGHRL